MLYLAAIAFGFVVAVLLVMAGLLGFAIARSGAYQVPLAVAAMSVVVLVGGATAIGLIGYTRLATGPRSTGTMSTANQESSTASASPADQSQDTGAVTDAWLHFDSDTRDYIGGGDQKIWTLTESNFMVKGSGRDIQASVSGQGDNWNLEFRAPTNGTLAPGLFIGAERAPFVTGKAPGLDVNGDGRGCNTLSGRFAIKDLKWTATGDVAEIDILFEQHCEQGMSALRGELWTTTRAGVHKAAPVASSPISF